MTRAQLGILRNGGSLPTIATRMRRTAFRFLNAAGRLRRVGDKIGARDCLERARAESIALAKWERVLDAGRKARGIVKLRGLA